MLLALLALALIAMVLRRAARPARALRDWRAAPPDPRAPAGELDLELYDPGRERRAEQRARELLRSCVNDEEWGMYRDLGFIRVAGRHAGARSTATAARAPPTPTWSTRTSRSSPTCPRPASC